MLRYLFFAVFATASVLAYAQLGTGGVGLGPAPPSSSQWFGGSVNLIGQGADNTGATTSDAAFTSAISVALAQGVPTEIYIPCGTYKVSQAQAITIIASQGIWLHGASSACVNINQTADADVFDVSLQNYGGIYKNGAFKASGFRTTMTAGSSTTRTAVSVASTAVSGVVGAPLWLTDLTFADTSASSTWAYDIHINQIPSFVYIDHINGRLAATSNGTHIFVEGNSTSYTTNVYMSDIALIDGNGVTLGDYLQGIHISNLNVLNGKTAFSYTPANGVGQDVELIHSVLQGYVNIAPSGGDVVGILHIHDNYFYPIDVNLSPSTSLVTISNVLTLDLHNNIYNGTPNVAAVSGLSLSGTMWPSQIENETISGFADGGTGLLINNTYTVPMVFKGMTFASNTNNISDTGTMLNNFVSTMINGAYYPLGYGQALTAAGQVKIDQSSTLGLSLTGWGSTNDLTLAVRNGTAICKLLANGAGLNCLGYLVGNNTSYLVSSNVPTVTTGFSTSTADVVTQSNGTGAWRDVVGSTPVSTSATFTIAAGYETNGLTCGAYDQTTNTIEIVQSGQTATTVTFKSYLRTTGVLTAPTAGDVIQIGPCLGH